MDDQRGRPLGRTALGSPITPPERILHIGLGAFHRAHQAWYTAHASDAEQWGIVAISGRRAELADTLRAQEGVYTVVERGPESDRFELIGSIVRSVPGTEIDALTTTLAAPDLAVVTMTITEAGYDVTPAGELDLASTRVAADLRALASVGSGTIRGDACPETVIGRLVLGLLARRRSGGPPLALVSCDNLPDNGGVLRRALWSFAEHAVPDLVPWLERNVSVVSTSVDRITPRTTDRDVRDVLSSTGWRDSVPVVTEPFHDWVLSGDFPSGRPRWEEVGARFVDEIGPWESRKLWLLNGAHTLLAAAGPRRGYETVADAIQDPECRDHVEAYWDEACRHLPDLELGAYRAALLARFENARIVHRLSQIAEGGLGKLRLRILPVARRELAAGRAARACGEALAEWVVGYQLGQAPDEPELVGMDRISTSASALVAVVDPDLDGTAFAAEAARRAVEIRDETTYRRETAFTHGSSAKG